jgi:hypothetical protein
VIEEKCQRRDADLARLDDRQAAEMTVAVDRANLDQADSVRHEFKKNLSSCIHGCKLIQVQSSLSELVSTRRSISKVDLLVLAS